MHTSRPDPDTDPAYVAAQTGQVIGAVVTDQPLELLAQQATTDTLTDAMGALVRFDGIVRDHDGGQRVRALAYEAHPSATDELRRVAAEVAAAHPVRLFTAHRTGEVPIGKLAFLVLAASAHRGDAFDACETTADRVKSEVPIWKRQVMASGETQWVGIDG
ncbi:molybdopterin converting factor [Corynebacterium sp. NML 150383]|uniref:molybdenum cofactor biosynthesis protein MoaE n=1 Tax=Corynebacterium sp. NML 150383 TaxID=2029400 RepID=UPI000BAA502C|nr:molybdenum cofactor biosynthesis protein MoaE [Corynebacterium sp. NML 150383]PAT04679.1 molybdopterin converting factor [Corynebacterium sp. NML 150383]